MLKPNDVVLVVVDVQGKLATLMHEREQFNANLVRMVQGARLFDFPIVWNEQMPEKLGETIPELKEALSDHKPLIKQTFSCCGNDDFVSKLSSLNRKKVLLTGMETHICVYQTAVHLREAGYDVHVVYDAVSSRLPYNKEIGITAMRELGCHVTSVEMALFEMQDTAEGDRMRALVKIVK